ncbi:MAG TPA: protein kinase family protein [Pseudonocardiaceae bacterium]|nr:protein kinase family protein [Pseudonocardiaceae bacterium]
MTQVDDGREAETARPVMTFGSPMVGEILAERYRLEEHINDDAVGRQVWRGSDVILRRPVAVVLRYPGGESAMEMLNAAVAASRVVHSHLVGIYDAIDEGERAYVVREWVEGASLREHVEAGLLDPGRATEVAYAVAGAVAAMHATGMVHGNIHPGTVMIARDGRVVLADARFDDAVEFDHDIRAIAGVLYFALTGYWPHAEAGRANLPDAVRDPNGILAPPRVMRGGVPAYLDQLTTNLLDRRLALPSADVLVVELGRLSTPVEADDEAYEDTESPLGFGSYPRSEAPRRAGRKMAVGVLALVLIATTGLLVGAKLLSSAGAGASSSGARGTAAPPTAGDQAAPKPIELQSGQVRIVDPKGDRTELAGVAAVVDGRRDTAWETQNYRGNPRFGGLKPGMGVLLDLGQPRFVGAVEVNFSAPGTTAEIRTGTTDPGSSTAGDAEVVQTFKRVGEPMTDLHTNHVFQVEQEARYLLLWITSMPPASDGRFQIGVQEIVVHAR